MSGGLCPGGFCLGDFCPRTHSANDICGFARHIETKTMLVHNTISELNFEHNLLPIIFHILTKIALIRYIFHPAGSEIYKHFPTLRFLIISSWTPGLGLGISASLILQAIFKTSKGVQCYGITHVHNDQFFFSTTILWKMLYFILFGHSKTDFVWCLICIYLPQD